MKTKKQADKDHQSLHLKATNSTFPEKKDKPKETANEKKSSLVSDQNEDTESAHSFNFKTDDTPYTSVQFIAYEIDTAPKNAVFINERLVGGTYLGLQNTSDDITQRCQLMIDAANTALTNPNTSADPNVLKIFMIPEFAFRGPTGAYTMEDVQTVISGLQHSFIGTKWANWLFVFGTIVGYSEIANEELEILLSQTYDKSINAFYEIYNVTLVQAGGYKDIAEAEKNANIVMKENMSGIDFMVAPTSGMDWRIVDHLPPVNPSGPGQEHQIINYDGLSIFQTKGLTLGVEICLDHLEGRLKASPGIPGQPMVQIQLIPSCGAMIQADAVVAQNDGYVFNVDGNVNASSIACEVSSGQPLGSVSVAVVPSPIINVPALYASGPGQIRIYKSAILPRQQLVTGKMLKVNYTDENVSYDFTLWYEKSGNNYLFDRAYCTAIFRNLTIMIEDVCLPVVNASIGNQVSMSAGVVQVVNPNTGTDLGVWMNMIVGDYHFEGIIITFASRLIM